MKQHILLTAFVFVAFSYAQEDQKLDIPESAEVFLEEYTDGFQDIFFNALQQKGIQNYDRAINLFLECKQLNVATSVIDHELAKTYLLDKTYVTAQQYAVEALIAEPANYWYLDTLEQILSKQSNTMDAVKNTLPFDNKELQKNLVLIYFKKKKYGDALAILKGLPKSSFKEELQLKLEDSLAQLKKNAPKTKSTGLITVNNDPIKVLELNLEQHIKNEQFAMVALRAKDAVETYPLQPYFYYAYGLALHKTNKNDEAIEMLESSLDYLFDDISLGNKIYRTLSDAYTQAGNSSKANEYLSKIKPGF